MIRIGEIYMNLISEEFTELISMWAQTNSDKNIFPDRSENQTTYYINREDEDSYIMEYSFKTLPELKEAICKYSGLQAEDELFKRIVIEICQLKCESEYEEHNHNMVGLMRERDAVLSEDKALPEYIYVF